MRPSASGRREQRNITATILIWIVNAAALLLASALLPGVIFESVTLGGVHVDKVFFAFIAAVALSLVTRVIEPVLYLLALPITVATFGLFTLVLNGFVLMITAMLVAGFRFAGPFWERLGWAMAAALIVSFFRMLVHTLLIQLRIIDRRQ